MTIKAQSRKAKIDKQDHMKLKSVIESKDKINRLKSQSKKLKKVFSNNRSNKIFSNQTRIHKDLNSKTTNSIK